MHELGISGERNVTSVRDPRHWCGATVVKGNRQEIPDLRSLQCAIDAHVIRTFHRDGVEWWVLDGVGLPIKARAREAVDVMRAGDQFTATMAVWLAVGSKN